MRREQRSFLSAAGIKFQRPIFAQKVQIFLLRAGSPCGIVNTVEKEEASSSTAAAVCSEPPRSNPGGVLVKKRSHKLLASALLECEHGFCTRRYELAFLFGSFQPDCNPLTYLKGSLRAYKFRGHNFSNSQDYINEHIRRLQRRDHWCLWNYYTLGKLTHYLADAFTFPHNENYPDSLIAHREYEDALRVYLAEYLRNRPLRLAEARRDLALAIDELHRRYMETQATVDQDARFILEANLLLMAGCLPASA